jgi:hypothetical protein
MKNKKLIAAVLALVIAALTALQSQLAKDEPAPAPSPEAPVAADAGV